ncbi:restriction endonuclease subunit S [[Clostridium] spiroforme]|nr:restriction endonuclease subunit S [Thomasclavelia spiroformis]MBM6879111.1 restriction endonuclease subunit S [Thomasclavelia spiroformis]
MCKRILKSQTNNVSGIPFYKIGTFGGIAKSFISKELFDEFKTKYPYPKKGDILISCSGTIGKTIVFDGEPAYFQDSNIVWLEHAEDMVLNKYLYYFYTTHPWKISSGGTITRLYNDNILETYIPLPPLPVQEEIIRILDNFTELTAELTAKLTAELTARNKQYEYYRNKLFSFIENVEYKTLDKVLKIKNGKDYKHLKSGDVPVYGSGGIMTYVDIAVYDKPSVLIPRKGSLDKLYYVNRPFWNVDTIFYTEINNNVILPKFVFYFLQTQHLEKLNKAGGVPSLTQSVLNKVKIPVPSLEEQQRIVDILDRFDKLCNDISEGLPAEIEARQKQYEYYRDKLLTFKPLEEVK